MSLTCLEAASHDRRKGVEEYALAVAADATGATRANCGLSATINSIPKATRRGSVTGGAAHDLLPSKKHLTEELVHLLFCTLQCASATRRNPVHPSSRAPESSLGRAQISLLLESVQDRVQRASAQSYPCRARLRIANP